MTRVAAFASAFLVALMLAVPAEAAEPCWTTSVTDDREIVIEIPVADDALGLSYTLHYVAIDTFCMAGVGDGSCTFSVWLYPESNGLPGLQRGDEVKSDVALCTDGTMYDYSDL